MNVIVPAGHYEWHCLPARGAPNVSAIATVKGAGGSHARGLLPMTDLEIQTAIFGYRQYLDDQIPVLVSDADSLESDIQADDLSAAKTDWLTAHLDYERLGAAYGTFGDLDGEINGSAAGLPDGASDPDFTGFLRLEYGLWHGQSAAELLPIATQLSTDTDKLENQFTGPEATTVSPLDIPLRAHEILENTLQKVLTGRSDEGSQTELDTLAANVAGTQEVIDVVRGALHHRAPGRLATINADLTDLASLVDAERNSGTPWTKLARGEREQVLAAVDRAVEDLSPVPGLLPLPPAPGIS
jgi:high-affinity iron transporter